MGLWFSRLRYKVDSCLIFPFSITELESSTKFISLKLDSFRLPPVSLLFICFVFSRNRKVKSNTRRCVFVFVFFCFFIFRYRLRIGTCVISLGRNHGRRENGATWSACGVCFAVFSSSCICWFRSILLLRFRLCRPRAWQIRFWGAPESIVPF